MPLNSIDSFVLPEIESLLVQRGLFLFHELEWHGGIILWSPEKARCGTYPAQSMAAGVGTTWLLLLVKFQQVV